MNRIWAVVRREYLERIRKKSFWIGTLLVPLAIIVLFGGQFWLMMLKTGEQRTIAVIDATGRIATAFSEELTEHELGDGRPEYLVETVEPHGGIDEARGRLEPRVAAGELFGIVTIGDDLQASDNFRFYGRNVGNVFAMETIEDELRDVVIGARLEDSDLPVERDVLNSIMAPVRFVTFQVSETGETKKKGFEQAYFGTFGFVFVLYIALLLYGLAMMRGILEEKSNRVMEVLLGSISPAQLMTGKILGIGLAGLTQMAVYVVTAGVARFYFLSSTASIEWAGVLDAFSPVKLLYFIVFFLLGYFMYTAMFATIGSVCNSEQEAQNLQAPVVMSLAIPMIATFFFVANPDSTIAVVVSLIPLFTPMVMFMRISVLTPPFWQIGLSILLTIGTIWLLFRGAAKIFRIGILMYGKRPSVPEIVRWARS
jgi:ABC-2 type transport system permease protein